MSRPRTKPRLGLLALAASLILLDAIVSVGMACISRKIRTSTCEPSTFSQCIQFCRGQRVNIVEIYKACRSFLVPRKHRVNGFRKLSTATFVYTNGITPDVIDLYGQSGSVVERLERSCKLADNFDLIEAFAIVDEVSARKFCVRKFLTAPPVG